MERWVKIYDKLLDWEWWDNPLMVKAWLYILLSANPKQKAWKGMVIERGQFVTSQSKMADIISCNRKTVRKILSKLVHSGQIIVSVDKSKTIISVCNYDNYQENTSKYGQQRGQQNGQQDGQQSGQPNGQQDGQQIGQQDGQQSGHNIRIENKEIIPPPPAYAPARENFSEDFSELDLTNNKADRPAGLGFCARARIPADSVADWLRVNGGQQWKETACMQLHLTMEQLDMAFDEFQRELIAQGVEDKEENDVRRHFMNMLRIAIRKNKSNGNDQRINSIDDVREAVELGFKMANSGH